MYLETKIQQMLNTEVLRKLPWGDTENRKRGKEIKASRGD